MCVRACVRVCVCCHWRRAVITRTFERAFSVCCTAHRHWLFFRLQFLHATALQPFVLAQQQTFSPRSVCLLVCLLAPYYSSGASPAIPCAPSLPGAGTFVIWQCPLLHHLFIINWLSAGINSKTESDRGQTRNCNCRMKDQRPLEGNASLTTLSTRQSSRLAMIERYTQDWLQTHSQCSSPPSEIVLDPIGELSTRLNGHFCCFRY